jgi:outer membrane protein assembly factor BamB
VVEPGSHRLLIATGNGPWNGGSDWGDSVLELSSDASRLLHTYTPRDQRQLEASDTDLGSSAPALLPPSGGRRLAIEGGKDGRLRLLDLERLGGTTAGPGPHLGGELQTISTPGAAQLFSQPAIARIGGRDFAFVSTDSGTAAYALSGGRLRVAWSSSTPGTSPVLAGGLLYVYDFVHGAVVVFRPASSHPVAHLRVGSGHWNSPVVDGGRVVVPEGNANDHARSGSLTILHLRGR